MSLLVITVLVAIVLSLTNMFLLILYDPQKSKLDKHTQDITNLNTEIKTLTTTKDSLHTRLLAIESPPLDIGGGTGGTGGTGLSGPILYVN
jgi:hypothetical protein